jgi:pre-60S factor REI1
MEASLTCTTCRIPLHSQEECRIHYKSDLHTYNLRRKVVQLAPLSLEEFNQRKQESSSSSQAPKDQNKCKSCNKDFASQTAYQQHLKSKKHRDNQAAYEEKAKLQENTPSTDIPEAKPAEPLDPSTACLFCNSRSESIEINLRHMLVSHGFFVPEMDKARDIEGMLKYLHDKIFEGNLCLYCDNGSFQSAPAVQRHMIDKQHCFMNTDEPDEYKDFYELEPETEQVEATTAIQLYKRDGPPGESTAAGELRLENGKILGHKEYARYYKQYYRPKAIDKMPFLSSILQEYRALQLNDSWSRKPALAPTSQYDARRKEELRVGMQNNLATKTHFRSQNTL